MMKRLSSYLGFAFAACLAVFSLSAFAEPVAYAYRAAATLAELPGVGLKRLELTLAEWRTGSQSGDSDLKSNLRASSNHFVMISAKHETDGIGVGAGLMRC
jgi:hypothetical protein